MKVACQQCGTAYSVADDKVAGRKVKLRCKHCNEAMVIDGTKLHTDAHDAPTNLSVVASASAPVESPFPVLAPPEDAGQPTPVALAAPADPADIEADADVVQGVDPATAAWHVAVGDDTQGPYTLDELARHYADGQIASDTLVYYDGASDWQEASEVEALTQAAASFWQKPARPSMPPPPRPEPRRFEPVAAPMGRDPFEERAQAAGSPRLSTSAMMDSSSRHEGTVQFSIDQIRAISSVSSPSLMPVASGGVRSAAVGYEGGSSFASLTASGSSPAYGSRPGYAAGGDSGLIDVSALSAVEPSPFRAIAEAQLSPLDTRTTPMVVPLHARNSGLDARTKVFAGLSALGFVLAAGVAALALLRTPVSQPIAVSTAQPGADVAQANLVNAAAAPPPVVAAEPAPVAERERPQAAAPADTAEDQDEREAAPRAANRERSHSSGPRSNAKHAGAVSAKLAAAVEPKEPKEPKEAKEPKAKAAPKGGADSEFDDLLANGPKKPAASKGGSPSIDDLLDGAVSAKKQPPKSEPAEAKSDLPMTPSRDAMLASLGKAKAKVGKCKGAGVATADITIAGSGKVSNLAVTGVEGAAKSCVESAVRSTPFPKFQKDAFQVKFPFKLPG